MQMCSSGSASTSRRSSISPYSTRLQPTSLSLDEFNEQGAQGLGPATYGWYQSQFNLRATDVLHQRPRATWFKQLAGTGIDQDTRDLPTSELMRRLRGFNPSFTEWADAAGLKYK